MPPHRRPHGGRGAPPWWPEGEQWPPRGPPWRFVPERFRRRFLIVSVSFVVLLVGIGVAIGLMAKGGGGPWNGPDRRGGPGGLFAIAGFVAVVGGTATALAYRRISRPVGELLAAAERLAQGDYDVKVDPDGPRELRTLSTTFNEMAGRLAASDEQRRRFLADVTHELRTPIAVLQSGIEAQVDGIHPRDDEHLASLLEEVQLLGRLVDDLHTLALADAGRLALHYDPAHPAALVDEVIRSHERLAQQKYVRFTSSVPADLPEIDADPTRVHQVLANLLSNAVRHSPPHSQVSVRVEADDDDVVRFTVTDSGPGFAPEALPHIFERFTRSADSRGSGLGLSIARDLVHVHGGTIEARNASGGGAVITFTLPRTRRDPL